jgi:hypothetical protein
MLMAAVSGGGGAAAGGMPGLNGLTGNAFGADNVFATGRLDKNPDYNQLHVTVGGLGGAVGQNGGAGSVPTTASVAILTPSRSSGHCSQITE